MFALWMRRGALIGSIFFSPIFAADAFEHSFISIDGDSFKFKGEEYRLLGLDAPEYRQTCTPPSGDAIACGQRAKAFLESVIRTDSLSCRGRARDVYSRVLATCKVGGKDLGALIVRGGYAIATSKRYRAFERAAKAEKLEIWGTVFLKPAKWRRQASRRSDWQRLSARLSRGAQRVRECAKRAMRVSGAPSFRGAAEEDRTLLA